MKEAKITIPSSITAILIEGEEDKKKFVEYITLRGLAIEQVKNGINMTAVQNCTIDSCRIGPLNKTAIVGIGHIQQVTISNCKISDCGFEGIGLFGRRILKNINHHNTITNNEIYNCGLINWHSCGIGIGRSGHNIIRRNHIHHTPYAAIAIGGGARFGILKIRMNENPDTAALNNIPPCDRTIYGLKKYVPGHNLIENNVIHDTMMRLEDGGAIYCHASQFNILRNNVVYRSHTKFSFGLYFDADEMYSTMENNLVYECPIEEPTKSSSKYQGTGLYMCANAKNYTYRNIVALTEKILWLLNNHGGIRIMDNIFVVKRNGIDPDKLPRNAGMYRYIGIKWDAGENIMDNNVYWCIDGNDAAMKYLKKWQEKGWDKNSIIANPGFKDIEKRDFSFDTSSIAWQMGIRPIDTSDVGIQSKFAAVK